MTRSIKIARKTSKIVEEPGPGVTTVWVALTDSTTATPVRRTISVVVPQARIRNSVHNLVAGSYALSAVPRAKGRSLTR